MSDISTKAPILVLGIGNILLRDEGIGVHVVRMMEKIKMPSNIELLDGGTAGADLLDAISNRQKVIVIDALDADVPPGTILRLTPEDLAADAHGNISLHELGIAETIKMAGHLKCAPSEAVIIAVKPFDFSPGIGLSEKLQSVLPEILKLILEQIKA